MRFFPILLFFILSLSFVQAQERCGIVAYEKMRKSIDPATREAQFEQWMKNKIALKAINKSSRTQAGPYVIPVVVHVIHNGEAIGTGTNISDAQIQSQIDVLNADFRRLNADAVNTPTAPTNFQSIAGSMNIQFVLAKQDPYGVTTTGIVRVKGNRSSWTTSNEDTYKALSFWRSDRYLNIWVLNLTDFLGVGQFPDPDGTGLSGLNEVDMPHDSITDGAAINYRAFGSGSFDLDTPYDKGRTVTHEVGHFLGLRHIWGDNSNCNTTTDYVDDTPKQNSSTAGCPSNPQTSCSNTKMFQNYMDYTNDACMNLFTKGQIDRMDIVLNNAIRRKSLLTSPGATPSTALPLLDIALTGLKSPGPVFCVTNPTPQISVSNSGNTPIQSFTVTVNVNNGAGTSQSISNASLFPGEEKIFNLNALSLQVGSNTLNFTLSNPNGQSDNTANNSIAVNTVVNTSTDIIPLRENFNTTFPDWSIVNPGNGLNWATTNTNYNASLSYNSYSNTTAGQQSWLVSPTLDLTSSAKGSILFDVSYAMRSTLALERLQVIASEDCGLNYSTILYDQQADQFSSGNSISSWTPSQKTDWRKQYVSLEEVIGTNNVRLAFVVTNQNGNNLYLDNFDFYEDYNSTPPVISSDYYIYGSAGNPAEYHLTFNLEERKDVTIFVYNMMGQKIALHQLTNILNQTYPIDLSGYQTGIYIIRTQIGSELHSNKVFLDK